jgi:hypothetical protein
LKDLQILELPTSTQLIITHAVDTNTDRGISFEYNTGVGTATHKIGFFGYDDSTGHLTYVPDATISNSVVSGVKGTLDVGAVLLDFATSGINTRGSAFFDCRWKTYKYKYTRSWNGNNFKSNFDYKCFQCSGLDLILLDGGTF